MRRIIGKPLFPIQTGAISLRLSLKTRLESETRTDTRPQRMKTDIRPFALTLLMLTVPMGAAFAQQPVSATVGVTAEIIQSLSVIGTNDLNFGQIVATGTAFSTTVDKSSPNAGRFEIAGTGSEQIQVTFVAPQALSRSGGAGTVGVNLQLFGTSSMANASSAQQILQDDTVTLSGGKYYFFVGGSLNLGPATENPPGTYSGEFELEVSYTSL